MARSVIASARDFFALRVPNSEFVDRPWRIHELVDGFRVEDVWALPTPGGPDDLATLVRYAASSDNAVLKASPVVNWLFSLRWRLGGLLGWDSERQQIGKRVHSLRDQLPDDLRAQRGPDMQLAPFRSVFQTHDEWAAEFSASMGHIVMHHGWVQRGDGSYHSQMTSLVKPDGTFGKIYMGFIKPFRYFVVYPLQFRVIRRVWPQVLQQSHTSSHSKDVASDASTNTCSAITSFHTVQSEFYAGRVDQSALASMLTDDVAWHVPGSNALAGEHRGREAVLGYFARRRDLANNTMRITVHDEMVLGDLVASRADGAALVDGQEATWQTIGVYRLADGRVAECWMVPLDQALFDRVWRSSTH